MMAGEGGGHRQVTLGSSAGDTLRWAARFWWGPKRAPGTPCCLDTSKHSRDLDNDLNWTHLGVFTCCSSGSCQGGCAWEDPEIQKA